MLQNLRGLVVIDEVQHAPQLFPVLRVLMDRENLPARFLLLGSASMGLLRQGSESLTGRLAVVEAAGFDLEETGTENVAALWHRGGYPLSYLADDDAQSHEWRQRFVDLFLQRDLPQLGIRVAAPAMLHAHALSRPDVERRRSRALAGGERKHRAPLPRLVDADLHGAPAPTLACQHRQAPGLCLRRHHEIRTRCAGVSCHRAGRIRQAHPMSL
ncbi:MAG: AAA family ATPase [Ideonella sp.]|nr:AAA family ATPase [Ideonella sp.]